MRIGYGYDSHRFEEGRPLFLGGINIPDSPGLKGHSDADVLIHAVIDAILGAAALGDIGQHFPDTYEKWRGADSSKLLIQVIRELEEAGYKIENLDTTVICEKPKLRPHIDAIRNRLAELMKITPDRVSVKGKTNEKMDDVGASIGIISHAVVLIEKR